MRPVPQGRHHSKSKLRGFTIAVDELELARKGQAVFELKRTKNVAVFGAVYFDEDGSGNELLCPRTDEPSLDKAPYCTLHMLHIADNSKSCLWRSIDKDRVGLVLSKKSTKPEKRNLSTLQEQGRSSNIQEEHKAREEKSINATTPSLKDQRIPAGA